ncbi:hypothetical protein OJAV_G00008330 [Oryzias javanicus]|uniref:Uncharacterized protein n=1 Tax=Oryzias javanicus TaxID=123683 RepID=A0A3S2PI05_ORYJA|nr:hypothetical protein OJAV_G00008330 [Oryzias javanicus]
MRERSLPGYGYLRPGQVSPSPRRRAKREEKKFAPTVCMVRVSSACTRSASSNFSVHRSRKPAPAPPPPGDRADVRPPRQQRGNSGRLSCSGCGGQSAPMVSPTMKAVVDAVWAVWSIGASIYDYIHTNAMEERIHTLENVISVHQFLIGLLSAGVLALFTYILFKKL